MADGRWQMGRLIGDSVNRVIRRRTSEDEAEVKVKVEAEVEAELEVRRPDFAVEVKGLNT